MIPDLPAALSRRAFLQKSTTGLGAIALSSLLSPDLFADGFSRQVPGALKALHFAPKAKRIIYLFMSGAPSHLDLFDPKPKLVEMTGKDLPESIRKGQRITTMTSGQKNLLCVGTPFKFEKHGPGGMDISELLPNLAKIAGDCTFVRSLFTDPINHDPAVTFFATGNQQPGRPTMGAWLAYGLGSDNRDLPSFIVLTSGGGGQTLQTRYWGSGFLPAQYGGVQFRNAGDPGALRLEPAGHQRRDAAPAPGRYQRAQSHALGTLGDPAIAAQIENYELAFRMQTSVPELTDLSTEPKEILRSLRRHAWEAFLRQQLSARAAHGGARRALHPALPPRLGSPRRPAERAAHEVQGDRSGERRVDYRPQAARDARRHAGDLGRRVRSHRVFARQHRAGQLSGGITIPGASRSGWPAAA
jgi:hypothetical protein